jgi:hypothetical protein
LKNPAQKAVYDKKIRKYTGRVRRCTSYIKRPYVRRIRRRVIRKINKPVVRSTVKSTKGVRKVKNKIQVLKNKLIKATPAQQKVIRHKIFKWKVVKGGRNFVKNYSRRCQGRIAWYRQQIIKNPAQKAVYTRKID